MNPSAGFHGLRAPMAGDAPNGGPRISNHHFQKFDKPSSVQTPYNLFSSKTRSVSIVAKITRVQEYVQISWDFE